MQRVNLDTNILIAAIRNDLRPHEHRILAGAIWCVSPIVFWELAKLAQKGKAKIDFDDPVLVRLMSKMESLPINQVVARVSTQLDYDKDPADELIGATSVVYGIPLLTRDQEIRASEIVPIADGMLELQPPSAPSHSM